MKQIFTFGYGQKHEGKYYVINAKTKDECRAKMFELFGQKWSFQYNSEKAAGVEEFNLKRLK